MKRLGMYTGHIYDESDELPEECCMCITDEEANDEAYIRRHIAINFIGCRTCLACPIAMKEN